MSEANYSEISADLFGDPVVEGKPCTKCLVWKPIQEFKIRVYKRRKTIKSWCRECDNRSDLARFSTPKGVHKKRIHDMAKAYGITEIEYAAMLEYQGGGCAICGGAEVTRGHRTGIPRRLSIDHNHETGLIRGVLCNNCNSGLARFHDNPKLMRKAIMYLKKPPVSPDSPVNVRNSQAVSLPPGLHKITLAAEEAEKMRDLLDDPKQQGYEGCKVPTAAPLPKVKK